MRTVINAPSSPIWVPVTGGASVLTAAAFVGIKHSVVSGVPSVDSCSKALALMTTPTTPGSL